MDRVNPLRPWARQILIGVGLFVVGGLIAFGYSWRPLHGSLTWKVDELETRLDERNLENLKLSDELAGLRSQEATRIDPETLAQIERELEKTKLALAKSEKKLGRTEKRRKEAKADADRWRKRHESLRESVAAAPTAPAEESATPPEAPAAGSPAAPAAPSTTPDPTPVPNPISRSAAQQGILPDSETSPPPIP
ncbi:MAG: hypothetical protein CL908_10185 [Deltaproteobacteria bacterium]|nr:hypothetical protein [Deltaproteobacteria bacterium]